MSRIIINDWMVWGTLLKSWATERSYFTSGRVYPRPKTLVELKAQLSESGAGSIPEWVIDFELIRWNEKKLLIELPSSETISHIEALLGAGQPYPLPAFYRNSLGEFPVPGDLNARLAFHTMRIGEHAISAFS